MTTTLTFNFNHPGLNGKDGLMRAHFRTKKKWKDRIAWTALQQSMYRHPGRVRVSYTRYSKGSLDWDNLGSSMKMFIDALVGVGMIAEDSQKVIPEQPILKQERGAAATVITIEDID